MAGNSGIAVASAALAVALVQGVNASGLLEQALGTWQASHFVAGLASFLAVAIAATWYAWRQSAQAGRKFTSLNKELAALKREDEERRTIAAIGLGASWDLDIQHVYARFARDLRQLVDYDRLTITSGRPDGSVEVVFTTGADAEGTALGQLVPRGFSEADGIADPAGQGFLSKLTVPFLAVKGTLTLRSRKPDMYGADKARILRQVVAHASPGVANALLYHASNKQLAERTALAEIGRAANSAQSAGEIFPAVRQSLSQVMPFDHMGAVLCSSVKGQARIVHWQKDGLLGLSQGQEIEVDPVLQDIGGAISGAQPRLLPDSAQPPSLPGDGARVWSQVPLRTGNECHGALLVSSARGIVPSEGDGLLLEQVALQIAPAIRNIELLNAERALKQELDSQYKELQLAQQAKDRFLSSVSHELRTPLAIISGNVDLLHANPSGNIARDQLESLDAMRRNARRLSHLINDLLDIARIGANTFKISPQPFDASLMLSLLVKDITPVFAERKQTLSASYPDGQVWLRADRDRLEQLVVNLLTNASKYSPEGSAVELTVNWDTSAYTLTVSDHGIGITSGDQARLFSPFYRVDNEATRAVSGTGLGLYISKVIVDQHGGRLTLESAPGNGTTVSFTVPCVIPAPQESASGSTDLPFRSRLYPELDWEDIPAEAA
jgi:signal transduction histidine kinase